jgi:hypothetical protein
VGYRGGKIAVTYMIGIFVDTAAVVKSNEPMFPSPVAAWWVNPPGELV